MKTNILIVAILSVAIFFTSCKKDPGMGGKAIISGVVSNSQGTVEGAVVSIAFGTTEATDTMSTSTTTAADGSYKFEGLTKGEYFIKSTYVDDAGISFESTGYAVTIGGKKSEVSLDIELL